MAAFLDAAGKFQQKAWFDYWTALWSAPTQPGYATLVRESLAVLRQLASTLQVTANANGATDAASYAAEAIVQLDTYIAIAMATSDGAQLRQHVTQPLLENPNSALYKIALAFPLLLAFKPLRTWGQIFKDEVVEPTKKLVKSGGLSLGWIIGGGIAAYLLLKD